MNADSLVLTGIGAAVHATTLDTTNIGDDTGATLVIHAVDATLMLSMMLLRQ